MAGSGVTEPVVVVRRSRLPRPAAEVWARVTTPAGLGDEFRPWLRMTVPPGLRGRTIADADELLDRPLGRAWLLLGGVLPVTYDDLRLVEIGPSHFLERSRAGGVELWQHHRAVVADGPEACLLTDRLEVLPRPPLRRLPGSGRLVRRLVGALFTHRHARLRRWAAEAARD